MSASAETTLPEWSLDDLYAGMDDPAIEADLARAAEAAEALAASCKGKLAGVDGAVLGEAIKKYESLSETLHKLMSYGQLLFAINVGESEVGRFYQTLQEKVTDISTTSLFFTLEINRIEDAVLDAQLKHPAAAHFAPWLREVRAFRDHQLSDDMEALLHEKEVTGRTAWVRLFEETFADMRIPVAGEDLTLSDALNLLSDKDAAKRKAAAQSFGKTLGENISLFSLITNTLAKDKAVEDGFRAYARPVSSRNLANQVEDEVVDALAEAVVASYPKLSHRYYALKAKWFGADTLDYWDRNAPLPFDSAALYSWDQAKATVLDAYRAFTPDMAEIAGDFFTKGWIDAAPRAAKDSGAFAHPVVPSVHPYVLMNFHGKARDVMTLAHELGHGVHQVLAGEQGTLMADTPLTTAETASVFGEMLTFRSMLDAAESQEQRKILLAGKVEDMLNTVVRQIAFHTFETKVHAERKDGELSADRLGEIWMEVQSESLGPALKFDDDYKHYWAYIPHFVHTPFYVYAYAFGDCLVNSLYGVFAEGHEGFQAKYLDLLKAGGTKRHKELLAPFGLDASDPAFWQRGLDVISGFIDELETMG